MEDSIIWFCKYILPNLLTAIIAYSIATHKERSYSKKNHDKKIYEKIKKIISDEVLIDILSNPGYLPSCSFSKCDSLETFIINPGNKFFDKKLEIAFQSFQKSFKKLNSIYSLSSYGDYVGDNNFKLLANKSGAPDEKKLLEEAITLGEETAEKYAFFRTLIKQTLYI